MSKKIFQLPKKPKSAISFYLSKRFDDFYKNKNNIIETNKIF